MYDADFSVGPGTVVSVLLMLLQNMGKDYALLRPRLTAANCGQKYARNDMKSSTTDLGLVIHFDLE